MFQDNLGKCVIGPEENNFLTCTIVHVATRNSSDRYVGKNFVKIKRNSFYYLFFINISWSSIMNISNMEFTLYYLEVGEFYVNEYSA